MVSVIIIIQHEGHACNLLVPPARYYDNHTTGTCPQGIILTLWSMPISHVLSRASCCASSNRNRSSSAATASSAESSATSVVFINVASAARASSFWTCPLLDGVQRLSELPSPLTPSETVSPLSGCGVREGTSSEKQQRRGPAAPPQETAPLHLGDVEEAAGRGRSTSTDWESIFRDSRRLIPSSTGFGAQPGGPLFLPPRVAAYPPRLDNSLEFQLLRRGAACPEGAGPEGRHALRFGLAPAPLPAAVSVSVRLVRMTGEVEAISCVASAPPTCTEGVTRLAPIPSRSGAAAASLGGARRASRP